MQVLTSYEPITPKLGVEKLRGDNYYKWSNDMTTYFEGKNLLKCILHKTCEEHRMNEKKSALRLEYDDDMKEAELEYKSKEDLERRIRAINKEWRSIRVKWLEEDERE